MRTGERTIGWLARRKRRARNVRPSGPVLYGDAFCVDHSGQHPTIVPNKPRTDLEADVREVAAIQSTLFDIFTASQFPIATENRSFVVKLMNWSLAVFVVTLASGIVALGLAHHGFAPLFSLAFLLMLLGSFACAMISGVYIVGRSLWRILTQPRIERALFQPRPSLAEMHGVDYLADMYRRRNLRFVRERCTFERIWVLTCAAAFFGTITFFANPIASTIIEKILRDQTLLKTITPQIVALLPGAIVLLTILTVAVNSPAFRLWRSQYLLDLALARQSAQP